MRLRNLPPIGSTDPITIDPFHFRPRLDIQDKKLIFENARSRQPGSFPNSLPLKIYSLESHLNEGGWKMTL